MKIHNLKYVIVTIALFFYLTLIFNIVITSPIVIALVLLNKIIADITKDIEVL